MLGLGEIIFAVSVPVLITIASLLNALRPLLRISGQASNRERAPILAFLVDTLARMEVNLLYLRRDGAELEPYEIAAWVRRCFNNATGSYVGTESHLPSLYKELYSDFLAAHDQYLAKQHEGTNSVRVLLIDIERLRTDRTDNERDFTEFISWHDDHRVPLLHLSPRDNADLLKPDGGPAGRNLTFLHNTDIAFWKDNYVLLFNSVQDADDEKPSKVRMRISFKGEDTYQNCAEYVTKLLEATGFRKEHERDVKTELPIYSEDLSRNWEDFCQPKLRLRKTAPFFDKALQHFGERSPRTIRVLDAAAGVGIEAAYLWKKNYSIQWNEIEPALREEARKYFFAVHKRALSDANMLHHDWLRFDLAFDEGSIDALYVIGNSLCHLETQEQVDKALLNFAYVLAEDGIFICDERNFQDILDRWDTIQPNPFENFQFNQHPERKVLYHSEDILGAPVRNENGRIVFDYCRLLRTATGERREKIGDLSMLPFKKGQLRRTLGKYFESVLTYGDLDISKDGTDVDPHANFYTYVATGKRLDDVKRALEDKKRDRPRKTSRRG